MEIIIRGKAGVDFPDVEGKSREFLSAMETSVRRRLELRQKDRVIFELEGLEGD